MFVKNNKFKDFKELSEKDLKDVYAAYKLAIFDYSQGGYPKAKTIADNANAITRITGMSSDEIRTSYVLVQNETNELSFGSGPVNPVGYNVPQK